MKNLQIEESPGETTAGLTSASQLVNMTDAVSFEPSNTASGISEAAIIATEPPILPQCTAPTDLFRDALRHTLRRQGKVIDILAKL